MRISSERGFQTTDCENEYLDREGELDNGNMPALFFPPEKLTFESAHERILVEQRSPETSSTVREAEQAPVSGAVGRVFDCLIAACMLALFLPVMVVIAAILKLTEPGPVFFAHRRVGRDLRPFSCFKFRTMYVDADERLARLLAQDEALMREWADTQKLLDDPRATKFGSFLRNTSLDELPQLLNVLTGDMSLVGPRPIIADEQGRYGRYVSHYGKVRPGLTGLWQVTRTENTSYRRRVATDVLYVRKRSLWFDWKILFATIPAVMLGNG